jgi:hypothetical protein
VRKSTIAARAQQLRGLPRRVHGAPGSAAQ